MHNMSYRERIECADQADREWKEKLAYLNSQEYRDFEEEILSTRPKLREAVETIRRESLARETPLEYLRRTRPDMDDDRRVAYVLYCGVAGKIAKGEGA